MTQTIAAPTSSDIRAKIGSANAQLAAAKSAEKNARFRASIFDGLHASGHPHEAKFKDAPAELDVAVAEVRRLEQLATGYTFAAEYVEWLEADEAEKELSAQFAAARERLATYSDCERLENRVAVEWRAAQLGADPMRKAADTIDDHMRSRLEDFHEAKNRVASIGAQLAHLSAAKDRAVKICSQVGDLVALVKSGESHNDKQ